MTEKSLSSCDRSMTITTEYIECVGDRKRERIRRSTASRLKAVPDEVLVNDTQTA